MIKVIVGTTTQRKSVIVPKTTTIRSILEENDIDYTVGTIHIDGASLTPGEIDKDLEQFGVTEKCNIIVVVKGDGGR